MHIHSTSKKSLCMSNHQWIQLLSVSIMILVSCGRENTLDINPSNLSSSSEITRYSSSEILNSSVVLSSSSELSNSSALLSCSSEFLSSSSLLHSSSESSSSAKTESSSSAQESSSGISDGQTKLVFAINAGGSKTTFNGIEYQTDRFAQGGTQHTVTKAISGTEEDEFFQSERYGSYQYEIPVTNATYTIHLHFAELYQTAAGNRTFNLSVEGTTVRSQLDLYTEAGALTAYSITVENISVLDEYLTIEIESIVDNGTLCGFDIWSADGGQFVEPPPPDPSEEDTGYDCLIDSPSGSNGGSSTVLPDPFIKWDGTQVKTMDDWRCRRREILVEVEKRILGEKAPPPENVSGTVSNSDYTVSVENEGATTSFSGTITLPSTGSAPYPAVIVIGGFNSLNAEVLNSEGVATISYDNSVIASESSGDFTSGKYYDVNPDQRGQTGALVAWAWGVSRIIDMLEKNPGVIDPTKIAVHGCSRLGKAAFVIGAFDQRIALGLPLEPGTGGAAPLRSLGSLGGQSLGGANGEASWFGPMSGKYSASMAVDMDDVATMYAPRGLLLMDNPHIDHLAYKANYLGAAAARKVFEAMGKGDALWYLGNSGNGNHCSVREEYAEPLRAMIKKFLKDDNSVTTGGLDTHANHRGVNVDSWTQGWQEGPISK